MLGRMTLMPQHRRRFLRWLTALPFIAGAAANAVPSQPPAEAAASPVDPPRLPVGETDHPVARALLRAIAEERPLPVYYHAGTTPGALRRFQPHAIYRLRPGGRLYANGFCQLRQADRTLRLDRISLA